MLNFQYDWSAIEEIFWRKETARHHSTLTMDAIVWSLIRLILPPWLVSQGRCCPMDSSLFCVNLFLSMYCWLPFWYCMVLSNVWCYWDNNDGLNSNHCVARSQRLTLYDPECLWLWPLRPFSCCSFYNYLNFIYLLRDHEVSGYGISHHHICKFPLEGEGVSLEGYKNYQGFGVTCYSWWFIKLQRGSQPIPAS